MAIVPTRNLANLQPRQGWWDPVREISSLQRQLNRMFEDVTRNVNEGGSLLAPSAELEETDGAIHLKLEVPGIDPNDLDVKVSDRAVAISGERKSESQNGDGGAKRSELYYGRFERVIPIDAQIQSDRVEANYNNGILHLTLPKAESDKNAVQVNVQQS